MPQKNCCGAVAAACGRASVYRAQGYLLKILASVDSSFSMTRSRRRQELSWRRGAASVKVKGRRFASLTKDGTGCDVVAIRAGKCDRASKGVVVVVGPRGAHRQTQAQAQATATPADRAFESERGPQAGMRASDPLCPCGRAQEEAKLKLARAGGRTQAARPAGVASLIPCRSPVRLRRHRRNPFILILGWVHCAGRTD